MGQARTAPTRRTVLTGTATGVGAALLTARAASAATPATAGHEQGVRRFRLRDLRVLTGDLTRPQRGTRALVAGEVEDADGRAVGSLHSDVAVLHSADRHAPTPLAAMETHTLTLTDGTIVGTGIADHLGHGTFAVIGGTGAYTGARGSFRLAQFRLGQGGDGTGQLDVTLLS